MLNRPLAASAVVNGQHAQSLLPRAPVDPAVQARTPASLLLSFFRFTGTDVRGRRLDEMREAFGFYEM